MKTLKTCIKIAIVMSGVIIGMIVGSIKASAAVGCAANDGDTWYVCPGGERDKIDAKFQAMQQQIDTLVNINFNLEKKVESMQAPSTGPAIVQPERVIETREIITQADNTRVEALEKRVGTLEKAVAFIQDKVMAALNITISMLKDLLKR